MGASHHDQTTATEHQNDTETVGRFPELTPVQWVQPSPFPGAGDITPHSEWMSLSMGSIRSWANGEIPTDREAAVLTWTGGLKVHETTMGVGGGETVMTGVLKGFGELSFGTKQVNGGVEVAELIFELPKAVDLGSKTPVLEFVG